MGNNSKRKKRLLDFLDFLDRALVAAFVAAAVVAADVVAAVAVDALVRRVMTTNEYKPLENQTLLMKGVRRC